MDAATRTYLVEPQSAAWQAVQGRFTCRPARRERVRRTYYDTFDWRIYRAGATLSAAREGGRRRLRWRPAAGRRGASVLVETPPGFAWDLPPGPLRDAVTPIIEMRGLQPVLRVDLRRAALRLLDRQEKTIVRVVHEIGSAAGPAEAAPSHPMAAVLRVIPVKGYDDAHSAVVSFVEAELGLRALPAGELDRGLAAIGQRPCDHPSRVAHSVGPQGRADAAVRQLLAELLETVRRNEPGVRQDIDTEFLHDLRVASRRCRALLGQVKEVLPEAAVTSLRNELSWLGGVTGPTRDLDVQLLNLPDYTASLPPRVATDLAPLGEFLRVHRREERSNLIAALDSPRYAALLAAWQHLAEPSPAADARLPNAGRPVVAVASEHIWRAYRRVRRRARRLGRNPPARALHRLRIDCKKLRYLVQFFRHLYPAEEIAAMIQALKQLQDNLGEVNDLAVQRERLGKMAEQMVAESHVSAATLMAMGRLLDHLEERQSEVRRRFSERLAGFTAVENRARFRRLFKDDGRASA